MRGGGGLSGFGQGGRESPALILEWGMRVGPAKNIQSYNVYNTIMSAVKRIPVTEQVWKDLAEMRSAGQTYTDLLADMIEDRKKQRLDEDVTKWSSRKKEDYVSLKAIQD